MGEIPRTIREISKPAVAIMAAAAIVGGKATQEMVDPPVASAETTTYVGSDGFRCTSETTQTGSETTVREVCISPDGQSRRENSNTISNGDNSDPNTQPTPRRDRRNDGRKPRSPRRVKFINYEQPTGNTCFSASFAMVAATLNKNRRITPFRIATSKQIRPYFTLGGGVRGYVANSVPALSRRYRLNYSPERENFSQAKRTIKKGGLSIVLYQQGHFASSAGHFNVLKGYKNGRFLIADPNRKGKSGDSERKRGWSANELKSRGAIGVWNFTAKARR